MTDIDPKKKKIQAVLLALIFFTCLLFFTLAKLPTTRITGLIQGYLQAALDPMGIYVTDQGRDFSILHGFRYTLDHPTFELSDSSRIEFDEMKAAPQILSLFKLMPGATLSFTQGPSSIKIDAAARSEKVNANIQLDQVSLGKIGLFAYLGSIKGNGTLTGNATVAGTLSEPASLGGSVQMALKAFQLDEQNLMGFQLDTMKVAEGVIDLAIQNGKIEFKSFRLGKPGGSDDLNITITGDITLGRVLSSSQLNLRALVGLSERVKAKLSLLDSIMGAAKQADGRYAYRITGTANAPMPIPDPK